MHGAGSVPEPTNKSQQEIKKSDESEKDSLDQFYSELSYWHVNMGEESVHAKRIPGKYRRIKWTTASLYLLFFFAPFLRWEGRQALLFDIPQRKYYLFSITIWPQDIWMLSILLMTFFISLFVATTIAGRVFCGYICCQTVSTDIFTWIEEKLEGQPPARRAMDKAPWTGKKVGIKLAKHSIFLFLSLLTGVAFTAYFIDVYDLWQKYLSLQGPIYIWTVPAVFLIAFYINAGFLREQVCFWLCPYARIQGVMADPETILPTYDYHRGEPRGRLKKGSTSSQVHGDCVDCHLCVAVCPTGIDIRNGQQEGCITCALCLDACDTIMCKVNKPKGLIRYMSLNELNGKPTVPLFKRARVLFYSTLLLCAFLGIGYGLTHLSPLDLMVIHDRQPLYVRLSDGSIQNKYTLKVINKTDTDMEVKVSIQGIKKGVLVVPSRVFKIAAGKVKPVQLFLKARPEDIGKGSVPIFFHVRSLTQPGMKKTYQSSFIGPS